MLVLTGPPGSGKSRAVLGELGADAKLLVPSATMAEHVRHDLARAGALVRPRSVDTLARFVNEWTADLPEPPVGALDLAVAGALATDPPQELAHVAGLPGLRQALAAIIEELWSAGLGAAALGGSVSAPVQQVAARVEREFAARGWIPRGARVAGAAGRIRERGLGPLRRILFDGFFSFGAPELELIDALRQRVDLTITVPEWEGSAPVLERLRGMGFEVRRLGERVRPAPARVLVKASTMEQEAEEIARRIAAHAASGRAFREMGIVLRRPEHYLPVLEAALSRFGIPARFYFSEPLARHAVVRFLSGVVAAALGGWEHEATAELVCSPFSGVGATDAADRFDFSVRESLPGQGLAALAALWQDCGFLKRLAELDGWLHGEALPGEWTARARSLASLVAQPQVQDRVPHATAARWRGQAGALEGFQAAGDSTAQTLDPNKPLAFRDFWAACRIVLENTQLRTGGKRRDVVHVLDVYEARQWELPVVFVCGLVERQFPLYHGANPLFPESARAALGLATAAERQREEELLFEIAASRATSELILSYPECNAKGDPNLPSFFLAECDAAVVRARPVVPAGSTAAPPPRLEPIRDRALLEIIRGRYQRFRATAIETYLACPFRFFIEHTLGLEPAPARPGERLDARVLGTIIHRALAEIESGAQEPEAVLDRVFDEVIARERVPRGCRTELARIRMASDLLQYLGQARLLEGWRVESEKPIRFALGDAEISGRIDRCYVSAGGLAVVFDFKYSGAARIRERIAGYEENRFVQAALYLMGLRDLYRYAPGGMFYCGLKGEVSIDGWHVSLPGFESIGTACTAEVLEERLAAARAGTLSAVAAIRNGEVEAPPGGAADCEYCELCDVCRLSRDAERAAVAGGPE
jgi:RecB family exonuclease